MIPNHSASSPSRETSKNAFNTNPESNASHSSGSDLDSPHNPFQPQLRNLNPSVIDQKNFSAMEVDSKSEEQKRKLKRTRDAIEDGKIHTEPEVKRIKEDTSWAHQIDRNGLNVFLRAARDGDLNKIKNLNQLFMLDDQSKIQIVEYQSDCYSSEFYKKKCNDFYKSELHPLYNLLENGALGSQDLNSTENEFKAMNENGKVYTGLTLAIAKGHKAVVSYLLEQPSANEQAKFYKGDYGNALMLALSEGYNDIACRLLALPSADEQVAALLNNRKFSVFFYAVQKEHHELVKVLMNLSSFKIQLGSYSDLQNMLSDKMNKGDFEMVQLLLSSPVIKQKISENKSFFKSFINKSIEKSSEFSSDKKNQYFAFVALFLGELRGHLSAKTMPQWNVLCSDAQQGHPSFLCLLPKNELITVFNKQKAAGKDMNATDAAGWNPLMYACLYGRVDVVEFLLSKGCKLAKPVLKADLKADHLLLDMVNTDWLFQSQSDLIDFKGPKLSLDADNSTMVRFIEAVDDSLADFNNAGVSYALTNYLASQLASLPELAQLFQLPETQLTDVQKKLIRAGILANMDSFKITGFVKPQEMSISISNWNKFHAFWTKQAIELAEIGIVLEERMLSEPLSDLFGTAWGFIAQLNLSQLLENDEGNVIGNALAPLRTHLTNSIGLYEPYADIIIKAFAKSISINVPQTNTPDSMQENLQHTFLTVLRKALDQVGSGLMNHQQLDKVSAQSQKLYLALMQRQLHMLIQLSGQK